MEKFPRTTVGGVSLPRLLIGTNWFLGYSHISHAKDTFIQTLQTRERITDIIGVFLDNGINAVVGPACESLQQCKEACYDNKTPCSREIVAFSRICVCLEYNPGSGHGHDRDNHQGRSSRSD